MACRARLEVILDLELAGGFGEFPFEARFVRDVFVHFHPEVALSALRHEAALHARHLLHELEQLAHARLAGTGLRGLNAVVDVERPSHDASYWKRREGERSGD